MDGLGLGEYLNQSDKCTTQLARLSSFKVSAGFVITVAPLHPRPCK
jgi:hypothetical protein